MRRDPDGAVDHAKALTALARRVDHLEKRGASSDARAELGLLRQEIAELRARLPPPPPAPGPGQGQPGHGAPAPRELTMAEEMDRDFWGDAASNPPRGTA